MITRYGKPSGPLLALKRSFFEDNDALLEQGRQWNRLYAQQPARTHCKTCTQALDGPAFRKQGVPYALCARCGHLNGLHEDNEAFCAAIYTGEGSERYAQEYTAEDQQAYRERTRAIYVPKVEFLRGALTELGEVPEELRYADFGAGSGYMVGAYLAEGLPRVTGLEVSETQVRLGNTMLDGEPLRAHLPEETVALAASVEADVVSMIGVLEHVRQPREILASLRANPTVRYLYLSVPLFSPTVFLEMVFPAVMQRQLAGGHTHLYTESSLNWLAREYEMTPVAAWWFGTDIMDLFRNVYVELERNPETRDMKGTWGDVFIPLIDAMQGEIDRKHLSSEVHMLLRFEA